MRSQIYGNNNNTYTLYIYNRESLGDIPNKVGQNKKNKYI